MTDQPGGAPTALEPVVGVDAAFLHTETGSTHWHVIGTIVLDDSGAAEPFDAEMLRRVLADRIPHAEVLRRRVVDLAIGISEPHWQRADVDLDEHVVGVALPPGAGLAELAALAAEIAGRPLPRDRPLWQCTVVDGLADGRRAIVAKIHHSLVDGVAAVGVLGAISDTRPTVPPPRRQTAEATPPTSHHRDAIAVSTRAVADAPAVVARAVGGAARAAWHVVRRLGSAGPPVTLPLRAPRVCLSRSITPARAAAFAVADLAAVQAVRRAYRVTFSEVAMAITAGILRRWLAAAGELPERALVAAVPTSVRREATGAGNEVSVMFGALPTHLADPSARVRFAAGEMAGAKAFHRELGPHTLGSLARVAPWNLIAALFRAYSDLGLADRLPPLVNLVFTSVPGPSAPRFCGGARMDAVFPLGPIFDGAGLNVTVVSYTDRVCFGFLTCPDVSPPVEGLAEAVPDELAELVTAARSGDGHGDERSW